MKVVYIAGKYSGKTHDGRSFMEIERNILEAREWAIKAMQTGVVALTPHLNSYHMELDFESDQGFWYAADLELLRRCDAVFLIPNWEDSKGARLERDYARQHGIPVFYELAHMAQWAKGDV